MPSSSAAYTRSGWREPSSRGAIRLPSPMPPMNAASTVPSDTNDDPMTSGSIWNQTTS